jgi:hypothetical protein
MLSSDCLTPEYHTDLPSRSFSNIPPLYSLSMQSGWYCNMYRGEEGVFTPRREASCSLRVGHSIQRHVECNTLCYSIDAIHSKAGASKLVIVGGIDNTSTVPEPEMAAQPDKSETKKKRSGSRCLRHSYADWVIGVQKSGKTEHSVCSRGIVIFGF